ncbi:MAG: glycerophosphodiester phosphodiesterase [Thioalkalivibrio sp.]|nr:MAG: glycerophosphodiester phosphodiesterase [Thioalkalivibrio sp.]
MPIPELIAHRGYAARYPENTLLALEAAVAAGARFVEVDVQLSADGVPVLFHDRKLRRMCGVRGSVSGYRASKLGSLSASEPGRFGQRFADTPLATLGQFRGFLEAHTGVVGFVEAKPGAVRYFGVERVLDAIAAELEPIARQCVLISTVLPLLLAADDRARGQRGTVGWHALGGVVRRWRQRHALAGLRPEYLFCDVRGLPGRGDIGFRQSRIAVYEVADATLALDLHRRGVDMIETFAIGELRRELEARAAPVLG